MSTLSETDLLLVQRDDQLFYITPSQMSTLNDTDLLLVERSGVQYKMEAQYFLTGGGSNTGYLVEFLLVAGGGSSQGAGDAPRSGGGAGGYISSVIGEQSGGLTESLSRVFMVPGKSFNVTIGAAGSNSIFNGPVGQTPNYDSINYVAIKGGGPNEAGGSGGGGSSNGGTAADGTPNQGFAGSTGYAPLGNCMSGSNWCHEQCINQTYYGAGGGAGGAADGVNGGDGIQSSITGTAVYYAGGGRAKYSCAASGSSGTNGLGQDSFGGGGIDGGIGNDGVLILRYTNDATFKNDDGGLTFTTTTVGDQFVTVITGGTGNISLV